MRLGIEHPPGTCPECGCKDVMRQRPVNGIIYCECMFDECAVEWQEEAGEVSSNA